MSLPTPHSEVSEYLNYIVGEQEDYPETPHSEVSEYLKYIAEHMGGGGSTAADVSYDNTESGLIAENVQDAINEVVEELTDKPTKTEVQDAINEVVEELTDKPNKTDVLPRPTSGLEVGKTFKIASYDSQTGVMTLEAVDVPNVRIKGVKAGGAELNPDADGYVDIPKAGTTISSIGVTYFNSNAFKVSSIGQVSLKDIAIDEYRQYQVSSAVMVSRVDSAVKVAMTDGVGEAWTDSEKTGAWKRLNSIKTTLDAVAVAGAQYFLGQQSSVSIVLPSNAEVGQQISVVWYNGATEATLSITGTVLPVTYTPSANSRSEINAMWDGTYWVIVTNEQAVPTE